MFDDNHIEKSLKSILENGQEDVPARIWDGITERLDKLERHKTVVLWLRRAGTVAAAAAIALIIMLKSPDDEIIVPQTTEEGMVAVVEPEKTINDIQDNETFSPVVNRTLTAFNKTSDIVRPTKESTAPVTESMPCQKSEPIVTEIFHESAPAQSETEEASTWVEDEKEWKEKKIKVSMVFSGTAGTNDPQSKGGFGPMKSPTLGKQYTKTTIERNDTETAYGIPVSVGTGVRFRFTPKWSLGVGINYTYLTSRFNGKYIKVNENGDADDPLSANIRNNQHYIGIPLNVYYDIINTDRINFYASAGGTIEKCLIDKYLVQNSPSITHSEGVKGVQTSVNAGIGVEFMIGRSAGIYIDPSLRYYFRNGQPKSIRTVQPLMFGIEVGLRFSL